MIVLTSLGGCWWPGTIINDGLRRYVVRRYLNQYQAEIVPARWWHGPWSPLLWAFMEMSS